MDKLKECPFCGSKNILLVRREESLFTDKPLAQLQCRDCYCSGAPCTDEEDPYTSWNTRTTPTPPAGQVEAVSDWPENIVADRHEISGKWVLHYLTDEQAAKCKSAFHASGAEHIAGLVGALEKLPEVLQFKINPIGGADIEAEGNQWFCHAHDVRAYMDAVKAALQALPPELRGK